MMEGGSTYLSFFFLSFFLSFFVGFSSVSSSTLVFLVCVLSTTDDVARLRAEEGFEGGDTWRWRPLRLEDFEALVEGILLSVIDGDGLAMSCYQSIAIRSLQHGHGRVKKYIYNK
jgi:hypothetical protein